MSDFEKLINASDLIEWIMETYPDWCEGAVRSIVDHVESMPSAQPETEEELPEIIRCKDCKYRVPYDWMYNETQRSQNIDDYSEDEFGCAYYMTMKADDYCSRA